MDHELAPIPRYPFPDTIEDPELIFKIDEYINAVHSRNVALTEAGWGKEWLYFAGRIETVLHRQANRITVRPEEAVERLGLADEEGNIAPGFGVALRKGQLYVGYRGETDDRFFGVLDRMIEWGEELADREENATVQERSMHAVRRLGILR